MTVAPVPSMCCVDEMICMFGRLLKSFEIEYLLWSNNRPKAWSALFFSFISNGSIDGPTFTL